MTETIIAAAIRVVTPEDYRKQMWRGKPMYPEKLIVFEMPPARHHSMLHPMAEQGFRGNHQDDQGFITSTGRYVNRKDAMEIAVAAGQVDPNNRKSGSDSGDLFSEDLW